MRVERRVGRQHLRRAEKSCVEHVVIMHENLLHIARNGKPLKVRLELTRLRDSSFGPVHQSPRFNDFDGYVG